MATVLYRKNGDEVLKISLRDQPFTEADTTYFGVLTNPSFPDGTDTRERLPDGNLGPARQLGFAKIAIPGTNTVRNATQAEIDAWAAAEQEDEDLQDAADADSLFMTHPQFRKVLKALVKLLVAEINTLRSQHSLSARTNAQAFTALRNAISKDD